jgi:hypothetical protein
MPSGEAPTYLAGVAPGTFTARRLIMASISLLRAWACAKDRNLWRAPIFRFPCQGKATMNLKKSFKRVFCPYERGPCLLAESWIDWLAFYASQASSLNVAWEAC